MRLSSTRTHEPSLSSHGTRLSGQRHQRAPQKRGVALAALALGLALPACPFTDDYFIERGSGGAAASRVSTGGSGLEATGGTLSAAGDTDVPEGGTPGDGAGGSAASGGTTLVGWSGAAASVGGSGGTRTGGTGGTSAPGGTGANTGGTGGDTGGANASGGTGGDSAAGTGGSVAGGGTGAKAGAGGTSAGSGGTAAAGYTGWSGGRPGWGGRAGFGGGNGGGGLASDPYSPLCDDSVVKGSACTLASPSPCYRTCGPNSAGFKSETCQGGSYVEQDGCTFPPGDYSCYAIPGHLPAECPGITPQATNACSVAACTVCFGGTTVNPQYRDSTGVQKSGYCVCTETGTWTCASTTSWPCPDSSGCN